MRNLLILSLLLVCFACKPDAPADEPSPITMPAPQKITIKAGQNNGVPLALPPRGQSPRSAAPNDLNGDGETDRLEVVTTGRATDGLGFERELVVYTGEGADLDAWYTATGVVLPTAHGGMMGDPLESVAIENGAIVVKHFGGSRTKWRYTHRFRWQNGDFQLIGTTVENIDPCNELTTLDYNLSTGKGIYTTVTQDCAESESNPKESTTTVDFSKRIPAMSMNGFKTGEQEFTAAEVEGTVYY